MYFVQLTNDLPKWTIFYIKSISDCLYSFYYSESNEMALLIYHMVRWKATTCGQTKNDIVIRWSILYVGKQVKSCFIVRILYFRSESVYKAAHKTMWRNCSTIHGLQLTNISSKCTFFLYWWISDHQYLFYSSESNGMEQLIYFVAYSIPIMCYETETSYDGYDDRFYMWETNQHVSDFYYSSYS